MFFYRQKFFITCSILILILLSGMTGAPPVESGSDLSPQISISTPTYPIGMNSKGSQRVPYRFKASGDFSGVITSRVFQFYTQYEEPLSDLFGPYPTDISLNSIQASEWNELVYLPESVVNKARAMEEYAIVLKTTFLGASSSGEDFNAEASILLLLPPASFSKSAPANGAANQPLNLTLQWNSTVGAIDYEYCFDTINNNLCDAGWTGTYRVKATLQNLSPGTTFYWQVRANNTSGGTYANNGTWWSFTTCNYSSITVTNINNSGAGSLRKAIADICPGGTINFAPSLSGKTITLASPLAIDKDMTIDGSSLSQNIKLDGAKIIDILMGTTQASNSTVLITDLDFLNARQHGFHQGSGKLEIRNSYFSGNDTGIFGGPELTVFKSSFVGNYTGIVNFDTLRVDSSLFTNNGRGIYNEKVYSFPSLGKARISASVFTQNYQGGIQNRFGVLIVGDSSFIGNEAEHGGAIQSSGTATIYNSHFSGNKATQNGGGIVNGGYLVVSESTFSGNTAGNNGGAVFNGGGVDLFASTFTNNSAGNFGGGIYGENLQMTNSTFHNNSAAQGGGIYLNPFSELSLSTFTNNTISNSNGSGLYVNHGTLRLFNNILANSLTGSDCYTTGTATITGSHNLIEVNLGLPNRCIVTVLSQDPLLGPLADNGGPTQTMALLPGSPAIDSGDDAACPTMDQRGMKRPQSDHCDIGAYEAKGPIQVSIGGVDVNSYFLVAQESKRVRYAGINSGPVKIIDINNTKLISAERVIYKVNNVATSFSEMMALPNSQLDTIYWLPWYNSKSLNTQLRIANVSANDAIVHISIGGTPVTGSPFSIPAGASRRLSFPGLDKGPVKIESNVNIVAAERVIYTVNGAQTSFTEMMALPNSQLDTIYWLPWYNSKSLDTQLRIANVSPSEAIVNISIGGTPVMGSPFTIPAGASRRLSFPDIDKGPVKIESNAGDARIVAAERVIYKVNNAATSFSEMMALPNSQLDTVFWLPWYNSKGLNTQLRIANVSGSTATVHVRIGGVDVMGSPFSISAGGSKRLSFAGIDKGPVQIESNVDIIAAERVIYTVNGIPASFSEMMGMPNGVLDSIYWLPWYNNVDLDTQLRFGTP